MEIPYSIYNAFTVNEEPFTGNGAGVCILQFDDDISDEIKQNIATEMNLIVTCFVAKAWNKDSNTENNTFTVRWFTPVTELVLCGHATLAAARAVFDNILLKKSDTLIKFQTKLKGIIEAKIESNPQRISLDFPLKESTPIDIKANQLIENIVRNILGPELSINHIKDIQICEELKYLLICLKDGDDLKSRVSPDFNLLSETQNNNSVKLVIVTQRPKHQNDINFQTRVFAPWIGVNEDPVCGSAHTLLAPYWKRQYKESGIQLDQLVGKHCSKRGGIIICKVFEKTVQLSGKTRTVVKGVMKI